MKIYGNAKSDGFPLLMTLVGAVFVGAGVGLSTAGGLTLLAAAPALAALTAVMVVRLRKWDVMSEVAAPTAVAAMVETTETTQPNEPSFPMAAQSDTELASSSAAWATGSVTSSLPAPVGKPHAPVKSVVETNTAVA